MRVSTEYTIKVAKPKLCNIYLIMLSPPQRTAARMKTACRPAKDWRLRLQQMRLPRCPIRSSVSQRVPGFGLHRGSSLPSSLNISSDFLQYYGTNLCPCWDNGKWKCAIELQNATKYLQKLTQDPVWGITSVKGHIGQSEPSIVAATCLLKTFRLSIKCRSPPLWSGQKLPFDINICCLPGCHGYSFRSQLIVFLTWIK